MEQTIHADDGEIEVDVSPDGSFKTPYFSGVVGKKDKTELDVVDLA